jgi:hypothetical protein
MKKFLKNIVKLKEISTIKDFRFGTFPVRVRVTLFTDHPITVFKYRNKIGKIVVKAVPYSVT